MKRLFFTSLIMLILSALSQPVSAQLKLNSRHKKESAPAARPVKFIEGIEIKREIKPAPQTTPTRPDVPGKKNNIEKSTHLQFKYAQLLEKEVEEIKDISLFNFIEEWWGVPYRFGGTNKKGIDCSAFTGELFTNVFATEIPRTAKDQFSACEKIDLEKMTEGDLVFFNTMGGVSHVGIYLSGGYFVHASASNGVTINNIKDDYFGARFLGGGRIMPVSDNVIKTFGSR